MKYRQVEASQTHEPDAQVVDLVEVRWVRMRPTRSSRPASNRPIPLWHTLPRLKAVAIIREGE